VTAQSTQRHVAALIPAAGVGRRLGGAIPKQFLQLGGREILAHTLAVFEMSAVIDDIWVVVAPEQQRLCQATIIEPYGFRKVRGVVAGGATRQDSVWQGLQQVDESVAFVVVHDGVRPFVTEHLLQQTLEQARYHGAAITAVPVKDTLKRVSTAGQVEATIPRDDLWRVQTPQAFCHALLRRAFSHAQQHGLQATDEAGLIEALGHPVKIVQGAEHNVKITTPDDLVLCETLLRHRL